MQRVSSLVINGTINNLLILLLEESEESRSIMATITLSPQVDTVIVGLVVRELGEESLSKVPQSMGSIGSAVGGRVLVLARVGTEPGSQIALGNALREISRDDGLAVLTAVQVDSDIGGDVVRETNLVGLVNVEHVDVVVPAPWVVDSRLGVFSDEARAVLLEQSKERGATRATVQPDGQGSIVRVMTSLKEPEEPKIISNRPSYYSQNTYVLTG